MTSKEDDPAKTLMYDTPQSCDESESIFACDNFASSDRKRGDKVKLLSTSSSTTTSPKHAKKWLTALTCVSAIGGALFGYDTGVVSGAMILIDDKFDLNHFWHELIVSVTVAAAAVSALMSGILNDLIGRKKVMLLAATVFTVGAVVMAIAGSKEVLLVGRAIVGLGIGFASMTVPVYISETAPSNIRGRLVVINTLFVTGGQFVATVIDGLFSIQHDFAVKNGWRFMLGLAGVPSVIMFVGLLFMPESPRWLVFHQKEDKARKVLAKTRMPEQVEGELASIREEYEQFKKEKMSVFAFISRVFNTRSVMLAIFVGCGLQIFQQVSGINTVMYYSASIIQMAGYSDQQAIWFAIVPAFANFSFTIVGLCLVERVGRRKLLIVSLCGVVFWFIVLAGSFLLANQNSPDTVPLYPGASCDYSKCGTCVANSKCGFCAIKISDKHYINGTCSKGDKDNSNKRPWPYNSSIIDCITHYQYNNTIYGDGDVTMFSDDAIFSDDYFNDPKSTQWYYNYCPNNRFAILSLVSLFMYLVFFAPGMGPLPWTINSEIYPMWARSNAVALATTCNWLFNLLVSLTFLSLIDAVGQPKAFLVYSLLAFSGLIFVVLLVPETKGISLEMVGQLFERPHFTNWCSRRSEYRMRLLDDTSIDDE
ncbi:proton myo-inositol cotransporter-like isoform X3 [Dysidea avara]